MQRCFLVIASLLLSAACSPPPAARPAPGAEAVGPVHATDAAPPSSAVGCDPTLPEPPPPAQPAPVTPSPSKSLTSLPSLGATEGSGAIFDGSIFERASAPFAATEVVVPDNATVAFGAPSGKIELYLEKTQHFRGHPPQPIPARAVQHNMGIATRSEADRVIISTYGEWDSRIEGYAGILLFVVVPEGTRVRARGDLSGDRSAASSWPEDAPESRTEGGRIGYWYNVTNPAPGWRAVPTQSDPRRTVRAAEPAPARKHDAVVAAGPSPEAIARAVQCVVTRHEHELHACQSDDPGARGHVEITWTTRADGTVAKSETFTGSLKDGPVATCASRVLRNLTFPKGAAGTFNRRIDFPGAR